MKNEQKTPNQIAEQLQQRGFRKVSVSGNRKFSTWQDSQGNKITWNHTTNLLSEGQ